MCDEAARGMHLGLEHCAWTLSASCGERFSHSTECSAQSVLVSMRTRDCVYVYTDSTLSTGMVMMERGLHSTYKWERLHKQCVLFPGPPHPLVTRYWSVFFETLHS